MYMSDKYLGFDYEFKILVKSARIMRFWGIGVIIGCFLEEQNGVPADLPIPAGCGYPPAP
jgi:hypothetical protein